MSATRAVKLLSRAPRVSPAAAVHQAQWRRQASTITAAHPHPNPEPLSSFQYFKKHYWAPEAAPLVAVVGVVLSLAVAFSINGARSSDVAWRPRKDEHPWLRVSTDQPHLEDTPAYVAPQRDVAYHGEKILQRKSFKVPRWMDAQ